MKRELKFDGSKAQKRFEMLYGAILIGGAQQGIARGIEVVRREARILDALDSVSMQDPDPQAPKVNGEPPRLVFQNGIAILDQPDFDLLKSRMETTPWLPATARIVVDTIDWLSAASEYKEEAKEA